MTRMVYLTADQIVPYALSVLALIIFTVFAAGRLGKVKPFPPPKYPDQEYE